MNHLLPELPYAYSALEPFIDETTMRIHHTKHHQAYVDKLNAALETVPGLQEKPLEALLAGIESVPESIRTAVRNHGGGHANHSFFWPILKVGAEPEGKVLAAIEKKFGGLEAFQTAFSTAAAGLFGSGWTWLGLKEGELSLLTTPNQDSPLMQGIIPVIGLDVWEHAYYLKYQNRRPEYIQAFFKVINWAQVEKNYLTGLG